MKVREDGGIAIRQSWLNDFLQCPEKARRAMLEPELSIGSDLTVVGTALHAVIEQVLNRTLEPDAAYVMAEPALRRAADEELWRRTSLSDDEMVNQVRRMAVAWVADVYPKMPSNGLVEWGFEVPIGEVEGTEVWFHGTVDYVGDDGTVWDHKSSSRKYQQWEKQRWAVQPSVYALAAVKTGIASDTPVRFYYDVMLRDGNTQIVELRRDYGHFNMVTDQALRAAQFALNYGVDRPWPLNDQSALCGPKWCPFWDTCKGRHMSEFELTWKP